MDLALIQLCPRVHAKMGNDHQLPLYLYVGIRLRATNLHPPCFLAKFKIPVSAAGVLSRPGFFLGVLLKGFEITSGFWMSLYVVVPQKPCDHVSCAHCSHIDASVHMHKSVQRESKSSFLECLCM